MARTLEPFPLPFRMRHWKKNSVGFKLGHKVVCLALCGVGDTLIYIGKTQKKEDRKDRFRGFSGSLLSFEGIFSNSKFDLTRRSIYL